MLEGGFLWVTSSRESFIHSKKPLWQWPSLLWGVGQLSLPAQCQGHPCVEDESFSWIGTRLSEAPAPGCPGPFFHPLPQGRSKAWPEQMKSRKDSLASGGSWWSEGGQSELKVSPLQNPDQFLLILIPMQLLESRIRLEILTFPGSVA